MGSNTRPTNKKKPTDSTNKWMDKDEKTGME